ncbi:MAG: hypothetical protein PVI59_06620 [Anaerolineae bacterium]
MNDQVTYEIRVEGWIGPRWASWFDGMDLVYDGAEDASPVTVLTGPVEDQAALRGLLTQIWDLNLTVISLNRQGLDIDTGG